MSDNYYAVFCEERGRRGNSVFFRIPGDSDNNIVNSQVTKNLILAQCVSAF